MSSMQYLAALILVITLVTLVLAVLSYGLFKYRQRRRKPLVMEEESWFRRVEFDAAEDRA